MENLEKFVNILSGAKNNMDGRVKLGEHGLQDLLDSLNTPSDYLAAGAKFRHFKQKLYVELSSRAGFVCARKCVRLKFK